MKAAHAGMGITGAQFNSIVNHLANTLKEFGVSAEVLGEVAAVAESTRADIVEAWKIIINNHINVDFYSL